MLLCETSLGGITGTSTNPSVQLSPVGFTAKAAAPASPHGSNILLFKRSFKAGCGILFRGWESILKASVKTSGPILIYEGNLSSDYSSMHRGLK